MPRNRHLSAINYLKTLNMKTPFTTLLPSLLVISILWSCGKDSPPTPIIPEPKCLIQSETYGLSGNEKGFSYEYILSNDKEELNNAARIIARAGVTFASFLILPFEAPFSPLRLVRRL